MREKATKLFEAYRSHASPLHTIPHFTSVKYVIMSEEKKREEKRIKTKLEGK